MTLAASLQLDYLFTAFLCLTASVDVAQSGSIVLVYLYLYTLHAGV